MQQPLISIIIPTFNRAHLIGETLNSVLEQTYTNWECIVVDDGSTDTTAELLVKYCKKDVRFQYHLLPYNRPKGANACRNFGFELSKGVLINWLDSDDIWDNKMLEIHMNLLISSKKMVTVTSAVKFQNNNIQDTIGLWKENLNTEQPIIEMIFFNFGWQTTSAVWNRNTIPNKPFDEELKAAQEWLFHIKQMHLLKIESFEFSKAITSYIRISKKNTIGTTHTIEIRNPNYLRARNKLINYFELINEKQYLPYIYRSVTSLLTKILLADKNNADLKEFENNFKRYSYNKWLFYIVLKYLILIFKLDFKQAKRMILYPLK